MYNFLRDARTIRNSFLCRFDTLDGYSSDFHINGNVDGWDVYNNICLYGCWDSIIFGSSYDRSCYIGRSNIFIPIPAENFYYIKLMMKITNNNPDKVVGGLTTGRIRWTTITDSVWNSTKQMDFDIIADNEWHLYTINMGPAQWWQGNISNLRVYPFIDGWPKDQFAIKYIKISSTDVYKCSNTQCSYYVNYSHPCPGAGSRGSCEAAISNQLYTLVSGVNDNLIVNIDGYGPVPFELGNYSNINGPTMARILAEKISSLNIGGYAYVECEYTEFDKLKIVSGVVSDESSVTVSGTAAVSLGFFNEDEDVSIKTIGTDPATGFDYASSRLLTAREINKLLNGYVDDEAYIHNPIQYNLEGGRKDYNTVGGAQLVSDLSGNVYYDSLKNSGKTIIDLSHPFSSNGRLKHLYMAGRFSGTAKMKIFRPKSDGTLSVVYSFDLPTENVNYVYTSIPTFYRIDCDVLVNRGDLIGVYNADLYVGVSLTGLPDATFFQIAGDVDVYDNFDPGLPYAFGVSGFAVYGRGDRFQSNIKLDIDLGDRVNIAQINVYGSEEFGYFEFNVASCLDLTWSVNLFGESHYHSGVNWNDGSPFTHTHTNVYYGKDCLDDGIRTADNGQVGTSYGKDATGLWTAGSNHSYFYVNGDAEWLYAFTNDGKHEYAWPYVPGSAWGPTVTQGVGGFVYDPIAFTLIFPYEYSLPIHKSIIYFKERSNFRGLALSYYLGQYVDSGNADDVHYKYIPEYTSISLDEIAIAKDRLGTAEYIYKNPMNDRFIYASGDHDPINWKEASAALRTTWNIIEHDFNPVECKGFRIFTNNHNSTKITEMEVYTKIATSPSLVDNVSMVFSNYGDVWNVAHFTGETDSKIVAFIGGSPRYMTLEFDSATTFVLNEIELLVGDQVKLSDCDSVILLDHAKRGEISQSTSIELENIYGRSLDLIVDVPKEVTEIDNLVFWSKMHDRSDLDYPQVGPPCKLYKQPDIKMGYENYQCAVNCPSYGLKNLIDGKEAYTQSNSQDWISYGALVSGVSLDYSNDPDYRCTEFTFPATSSEYWKISFPDWTSYTMGFTKSSNWSTQYGISRCTFTYETANYYSPLTFSIPDTNLGHDMAYRQLGSTLSKTTPFEVRFTVKPTSNYHYCFVYIGMINAKVGSGHPMGVYLAMESLNKQFGLRVVDSGAGYNEQWNGNWSLNTIYYVRLWSDGANNYYCRVWSDKWNGSSLVSNCAVSTTRVWTSDKWGITNGYNGGAAGAYLAGILSDAIFHIKDVFCYLDSTREDSSKIYYTSIDGITSQSNDYASTGSSLSPLVSIRPDNNAFGIKLPTSDPLNKIRIVHTNNSVIGTVRIYTSPDNASNYFLISSGTKTLSNNTFYGYFAIDLEKRHDLDIIRNYGTSTNKYAIGVASNIEYSNSETSNIESVAWNTGTKDDARWIRVKWTNGDGTTRTLRKLGIYSDITSAYCRGGGYNCEWEPLGTILSDYTPSINVAYGSTTTGTNYYFLYSYPDYAVDGIHTNYNWGNCWAFQTISGVNAYLELDFGDVYVIDKVVLYHGYSPDDGTYMNTAYTISVSDTISGSFTTIVTKTGNTAFTATHQFTPVSARRLRFTVTGYNTARSAISDPVTGEYFEFKGSFLREIEVYKHADTGYVDSETWPVVCMDLVDQFTITGHDLVSKDISDPTTDWDNAETFFKYSDNVFSNPQKVSFADDGEIVIEYQKISDSGNIDKRTGTVEYLFGSSIYFNKGVYDVVWDAKNSNGTGSISLRLDGPYVVDHAVTLTGTSYVQQLGTIEVPEGGFYDVKGFLDETYSSTTYSYWAVRNPIVYRAAGLRKWIAVTRDTATNYGTPSGIDYLSLIKVYGDEEYSPFEYSWWWSSVLSTLSNDIMNTLVGKRSLKIDYPASSGTDMVMLGEGDSLSNDIYFDAKNFLHFWWYISDVSKLDTSFGNLKFGNIYEANPIYYQWNISNLSLSSGWNDVSLKFEEADYTYPTTDESVDFFGKINNNLDFRNNGRDIKSIVLTYRGLGQPLTMNLDDLQIKRNVFNDDVRYGKGLFLMGNDYLEVPVSTISLERGTIEFWFKSFFNYYGADIFENANSRVLFTIVNNNNDIISLGIESTRWIAPFVGKLQKSMLAFYVDTNNLPPEFYINIGDVVHMALVWSNNGHFMDNGDTIRFYMNGQLIASTKETWFVDDTKAALVKFGGPNTQYAYNYDIWGGGIFENVKIYNYCKTSFNLDYEGVEKDVTYTPNDFLQISQDNINFYGIGSAELPFVFEQVPAGTSKTIYIRTNKTDRFKQSKPTATLIVEWLSSV